MSCDPFKSVLADYVPDYKKPKMIFKVIAVLSNEVTNRNLKLIRNPSRAFVKSTVVEFLITSMENKEEEIIQDISYLCFAEILESGLLVKGDKMIVKEQSGYIIGFNEDHAPNHINVLISLDAPMPGRRLGLEPGDPIFVEERTYIS